MFNDGFSGHPGCLQPSVCRERSQSCNCSRQGARRALNRNSAQFPYFDGDCNRCSTFHLNLEVSAPRMVPQGAAMLSGAASGRVRGCCFSRTAHSVTIPGLCLCPPPSPARLPRPHTLFSHQHAQGPTFYSANVLAPGTILPNRCLCHSQADVLETGALTWDSHRKTPESLSFTQEN